MGDEHIDVGEGQSRFADRLDCGVAHDADREAEGLVAIHLEVWSVLRKDARGLRHIAAPAGYEQVPVAGAVRSEHGRKQASLFLGSFDYHRAGAIAKEDAG